MINWSTISFQKVVSNRNKNKTDTDSILPISYNSSSRKKTILGYIYIASSSITTVITESCHSSFVYATGVASSVVKFGKSSTNYLPKTHQDVRRIKNFGQQEETYTFEAPKTPTTTPIVAMNEQSYGKWDDQEIIIKTPSPFHY